MIKIAFLSWHFQTPKIFLDTLLKMTPNCSGKWKNVEAVTDPFEADFCCIFDGYSAGFPEDRAIYFGQHPFVPGGFSPAFRTWENKKALLRLSLDKHLNPGEWWISHDYDTLSKLEPPKKDKYLICVMTYQTHNAMYSQRWKFMQEFVKRYGNIVDIYGRPEENFNNDAILKPVYKGALGFNKPDGTKGEHLVGKEVIADYKYTVEFDVGPTQNYFSERFYDSIFLWCHPIYFGSNNVSKWVPEKAFTNIDINNLHQAEVVYQKAKYPPTEEEMKATAEARDLLLNKYQTWAYVHAVVNNLDHFKNGGTIEQL